VRDYFSLLVFALMVAAVASVGALFGPGPWYEALTKPSWNPPNWLFGPVWAVLYLMIAIAGWQIWRQRSHRAIGLVLGLFGLQLLLNAAWSWLFFGLKRIDWALLEIALLWCTIGLLIKVSWNVSRRAAYLLMPYWVWVSFATTLNFSIWLLNRTA